MDNKVKNYFSIFFISSIMIFPRSFLIFKLTLLLIYIFSELFYTKKIIINNKLLNFYVSIILIGSFGCLVAVMNGNPEMAIWDSLRLYIIWSIAYFIIMTFIVSNSRYHELHISILMSSFIIFLINFLGLLDSSMSLEIFSEKIKQDLDLYVGFHEGYIQITSHNIGCLFFLIAYLYTFVANTKQKNIACEFIVLIVALGTALMSGRRALWICIILLPILDICLSKILLKRSPKFSKLLVLFYFLSSLMFLLSLLAGDFNNSTLWHVASAFSAEDERSIQLGYLVEGFFKNYLVGTGFGGDAGYTRNIERPWLYELTYFQMIFNFGIIGCFFIFSVFIYYIGNSISQIRKLNISSDEFLIKKSMMIGVFSFLIGCYSNPYMASFDFLIYIALIPVLSIKIDMKRNSDA